MDELIRFAQELSSELHQPILPIPMRVAYVIGDTHRQAGNGDWVHTHAIARALHDRGFEVLCFNKMGGSIYPKVDTSDYDITKEVDGVKYIQYQGAHDLDEENALLKHHFDRFTKLFQVYRPAWVLSTADYAVSLPAWLAAKHLEIPFYIEFRNFKESHHDVLESSWSNSPQSKIEVERNAFAPQMALKVFTLNQSSKNELIKRGVSANSIETGTSDSPQCLGALIADELSDSYSTARTLFYEEGRLSDALLILKSLRRNGMIFDKSQREFSAFVQGLARLKGGWKLPPRQPNAGLMTRRRHLLYCLHQSLPHTTNGCATRSHGIASSLQKAGWKLRATTRPGFPWDSGAKGLDRGYHETVIDSVTYAATEGRRLKQNPLDHYMAQAADHYMREAQLSGAEIIVAASNHMTALPALMAARRLGLPFVYEVRGLWEVTQASNQQQWAGSECYELARELEQQAALEADHVITITEGLADELASWGVSRDRITLVPNAVNTERFRPMAADLAIAKELKLEPGIPVIGYAGSVIAYEGLTLLMEAMALLKNAGQAFFFLLVGDGNEMEDIRQMAASLNIHDNCRFVGRVSYEQIPSYLSCVDIMPIPRRSCAVTEMVSALKPLEAMAMGKAVVLSDVAPHKNIAGQNSTRARLFTKDNPEALKEALQDLIDNPKERQRLGQAARTWIEQKRSWDDVTKCYSATLEHIRNAQAALGNDANAQALMCLDQVTLGLIADQFTSDTLGSAVKVVHLSPDNWREELSEHAIDALFVESAWNGHDGQWHERVAYHSEKQSRPLVELLEFCREQGIPSLFWNKEDPVHFERFRKTASLCDHVFTTDCRRIIPYLSTPRTLTQTVSSCPFYASPKIHNLLPSTRKWQPTSAYGGTYYGERYPERTEYMDIIMNAAAPLGLTIYDRQHNDPESTYNYPGRLASYVVSGLSYKEMIQAYKAHPIQINVNSVLDSPTMFSRRVMEVTACGSPLISGPSLGMNRFIEGVGVIVNTESEATQALKNLMHHPAHRWRHGLKGARAIMRAHTTQHRLVQMLRTAGMVIQAPQPPSFHLMTKEVTVTSAKHLLCQTLRPERIVAKQWQPGIQAQLESAGIACTAADVESIQGNSLWLLADPKALEHIEPEDFEDLIWPTLYAPQARIGFMRDSAPGKNQWPGVALVSSVINPGLQLVRANSGQKLSSLWEWAAQQPALALRKPTPQDSVPTLNSDHST